MGAYRQPLVTDVHMVGPNLRQSPGRGKPERSIGGEKGLKDVFALPGMRQRHEFAAGEPRIIVLIRKDEAIAAVPDAYLEQTTLAGTPQRISKLWESGVAGPGVTGLIVSVNQPEALELVADLAGLQRRTAINTQIAGVTA